MVITKTNGLPIFFFAFTIYITSCNSKTNTSVENDPKKQELATIDSLLGDTGFTQSMARAQDSSYYAGIGETPPAFFTPAVDFVVASRGKSTSKVTPLSD